MRKANIFPTVSHDVHSFFGDDGVEHLHEIIQLNCEKDKNKMFYLWVL